MARQEYRGPTDTHGRSLFDGGEPYGSELAWSGWLVGSASDPSAPADTAAGQFGANYLKYMAYWNNPPQSFSIRDFAFTDAGYQKLAPLGGIYNATDPDLRAFRDHGGKLILYHGWADQAIPPFATIDYYAAVEREMGGFAAAQQFSRLYMVPGAYHCLGGGDPDVSGDLLTPLINWVEHGNAPGPVTFPVLSQTTGTPQHTLTVAPCLDRSRAQPYVVPKRSGKTFGHRLPANMPGTQCPGEPTIGGCPWEALQANLSRVGPGRAGGRSCR